MKHQNICWPRNYSGFLHFAKLFVFLCANLVIPAGKPWLWRCELSHKVQFMDLFIFSLKVILKTYAYFNCIAYFTWKHQDLLCYWVVLPCLNRAVLLNPVPLDTSYYLLLVADFASFVHLLHCSSFSPHLLSHFRQKIGEDWTEVKLNLWHTIIVSKFPNYNYFLFLKRKFIVLMFPVK